MSGLTASGAFPAAFDGLTVYFDANLFIYSLVAHPVWGELSSAWLQHSASRLLRGVTGHLTLAECLVKPLRENNAMATDAVRAVVGSGDVVELLPLDRDAFEQAAKLRALHGLKLVDALHVATALRHRADVFLSNDQTLVSALSNRHDLSAVLLSSTRASA